MAKSRELMILMNKADHRAPRLPHRLQPPILTQPYPEPTTPTLDSCPRPLLPDKATRRQQKATR